MKPARWGAAVVLIAAVLAGCGDDDDEGSRPEFEEITIERSGGIDGLQEGVRITADGAVEATLNFADDPYEPTGETLDDDTLAELVTLVTSDQFLDVEADYHGDDECCDQFDYAVTAEVGGQTVTTAYSDLSEEVPNVLFSVNEIVFDQLPTDS